jgi:uncharacterized protein YjbI with pentapeptide repeats
MLHTSLTTEEHRVDQEQQSRWQQIIRNVLWTVGIYAVLVVAIIIVLGYVREWEWTGLVKDKAYTKRTLWNWLELLIIPAVLAGVGLWFNRQQREQESRTADRRAQDEALQAYLDQMSDMLIPNNDLPSLSGKHPPDNLKTVARARTLTVLPRLDGDRKGRVVQFLYESNLIPRLATDKQGTVVQEKVVDLTGANLRDTNLYGLHLPEVGLDSTLLERAILRNAYLKHANLAGSKLSGADLADANLTDASLWSAELMSRPDLGLKAANLRYANLVRTDLSDADLSGADLSGAFLFDADLSGADLSGAFLFEITGWTEEQLEKAKTLEGATMPNGQKYEDWLKSKDREEGG